MNEHYQEWMRSRFAPGAFTRDLPSGAALLYEQVRGIGDVNGDTIRGLRWRISWFPHWPYTECKLGLPVGVGKTRKEANADLVKSMRALSSEVARV